MYFRLFSAQSPICFLVDGLVDIRGKVLLKIPLDALRVPAGWCNQPLFSIGASLSSHNCGSAAQEGAFCSAIILERASYFKR